MVHLIEEMIQVAEKQTLICGVRVSGTHVGVLMMRSQKVSVKNGVNLVKIMMCTRTKVYLTFPIMERMKRKGILIGHGDLTPH